MRQRETVDDVIVNPQLSAEQKNQVKDFLVEYSGLLGAHHTEGFYWSSS